MNFTYHPRHVRDWEGGTQSPNQDKEFLPLYVKFHRTDGGRNCSLQKSTSDAVEADSSLGRPPAGEDHVLSSSGGPDLRRFPSGRPHSSPGPRPTAWTFAATVEDDLQTARTARWLLEKDCSEDHIEAVGRGRTASSARRTRSSETSVCGEDEQAIILWRGNAELVESGCTSREGGQ